MTCLEVQADGGENQALEILNQIVKGAKTLRILAFLNFKKRANLGGLQKEEKRIVKEEKEKKKKEKRKEKKSRKLQQRKCARCPRQFLAPACPHGRAQATACRPH